MQPETDLESEQKRRAKSVDISTQPKFFIFSDLTDLEHRLKNGYPATYDVVIDEGINFASLPDFVKSNVKPSKKDPLVIIYIPSILDFVDVSVDSFVS